MTDNESGKRVDGIDRRTVLKGAAAGAGTVAMSGLAAAGKGGKGGNGDNGGEGGQPCFKYFECDEGAYVKIEFVIEEDEDGNITDCYFEEETDTDLLEVTHWESKEGKECEPVYLEIEGDSHEVTAGLAYGGKDCDETGFDLDPEEGAQSYSSNLQNNGGQRAAISNLQLCAVPKGEEIIGDIAFAYEDLPKSDSDWDLNDWQVDLNATFMSDGTTSDGLEQVTQLTFEIIPQARGAADNHEWHIEFLESVVGGCPFDARLVKRNQDSSVKNTTERSYDGNGNFDLEVWSETLNALPDLENTGEDCTFPQEWATLTVTFTDGPCAIDVPTEPQDLGVNATELFFDPYLRNLNGDRFESGDVREVHQGDIRLVAVPDAFNWPLEREPVWKVYDNVSEDQSQGYSQPSYDSDTWYNDGYETSLATNCNFEPDDAGGGGLIEP